MILAKTGNLILGTSLFLLMSCGYQASSPIANTSDQSLPEGSDTFNSIQTNIIRPSCLKCHNGPDSNGDLSTYNAVLSYVTPGNAGTSEFFTLIDSGSMPKKAPKLSQSKIDAVKSWISKGALNN